jgi:hypothetical protein
MVQISSTVQKILASQRAQQIVAAATSESTRKSAVDALHALIPPPARWFVNKAAFARYVERHLFDRVASVSKLAQREADTEP